MANLTNVIKIKAEDYSTIITAYPNSAVISTGATVTYDPNAMYLVDDEVGVSQMEVLWSNSPSATSFSAQTISGLPDMSQYDYIQIAFKGYYNQNSLHFTDMVKYGSGGDINLNRIDYYNNKISTYSRRATFASSTSITFTSAAVAESTSTSAPGVGNDMNIPMYIYGCKRASRPDDDWHYVYNTLSDSLCVRYCKMGTRTLLHIHFQGYSVSTIGQTVYTISDTNLRPSVTMRGVISIDKGTTGRYSCGVDVMSTGAISVYPHTPTQYTGSFSGNLFGDVYIWL